MYNFFDENQTIKTKLNEGENTVTLTNITATDTAQRVTKDNNLIVISEHYTLTVENDTQREQFNIYSNEYSTREEKLKRFLLGIQEQKHLPYTNANELLNHVIIDKVPFVLIKIPFTISDNGNTVTRYTYRTASQELLQALED